MTHDQLKKKALNQEERRYRNMTQVERGELGWYQVSVQHEEGGVWVSEDTPGQSYSEVFLKTVLKYPEGNIRIKVMRFKWSVFLRGIGIMDGVFNG